MTNSQLFKQLVWQTQLLFSKNYHTYKQALQCCKHYSNIAAERHISAICVTIVAELMQKLSNTNT